LRQLPGKAYKKTTAPRSGEAKHLSSLKVEVYRLAFLRRHGYLDVLRRVQLMPGFQRVLSGGETFDGKRTVVARDRKKWMVHHSDIGAHPRVDIALHVDHDFFTREALQ